MKPYEVFVSFYLHAEDATQATNQIMSQLPKQLLAICELIETVQQSKELPMEETV
jgi:conjugal transfer/entry exclusion protein